MTNASAYREHGWMQSWHVCHRVTRLLVGPLYYCNESIVGESVEVVVDTGSSATILSFDLFKQIGKKAKIPVSAL